MTDAPDKPQESPKMSHRYGLQFDDIRAAEVWFDEHGTLYARSFSSGVAVAIELLGEVHIGQLIDDAFVPMATFAPEHLDEGETPESEKN